MGVMKENESEREETIVVAINNNQYSRWKLTGEIKTERSYKRDK